MNDVVLVLREVDQVDAVLLGVEGSFLDSPFTVVDYNLNINKHFSYRLIDY